MQALVLYMCRFFSRKSVCCLSSGKPRTNPSSRSRSPPLPISLYHVGCFRITKFFRAATRWRGRGRGREGWRWSIFSLWRGNLRFIFQTTFCSRGIYVEWLWRMCTIPTPLSSVIPKPTNGILMTTRKLSLSSRTTSVSVHCVPPPSPPFEAY